MWKGSEKLDVKLTEIEMFYNYPLIVLQLESKTGFPRSVILRVTSRKFAPMQNGNTVVCGNTDASVAVHRSMHCEYRLSFSNWLIIIMK